MNDKQKPSIRFKGFTEAWEQRKAKDLCSISTGKSNTQDKIEDGIYPFYVRSPIVERSNRYLYDEEAVLTVGDGVGTGKVFHYVNGKYDLHQRVYRMFDFSDGVSAKYFYYYFSNHFYERVMAMTAKTSVDSVRYEMIANMDFSVPNLEAQRKISAYFEYLDHLITLHQRKYDKLVNVKKSMLEKMFPQGGECVPEIRFSGFTEAWEQRKLTDFVEFFSGLTYTPNDIQETGTLVLRSSNVSNGEIVNADNVYVKSEAVNLENVKEEDIIVVVRNGSRSLIGKHAQIKRFMPNTVIGAFMTGIRSECPSFTNALLNTPHFDEEIAMNMGATINQITGYMFSKMEFKVPGLSEQRKIGKYFESLDHLITLHQRELEKLQNIKKSCLEKMFL